MWCVALQRFLIVSALWLCVSYASTALLPHETRSYIQDALIHASCLDERRPLPLGFIAGAAA